MNYSGCFTKEKKICVENPITSNPTTEKSISEQNTETDLITSTIEFNDKNQIDNIDEFQKIYEDLRIKNPTLFQKVISLNKIFLDKVTEFNKEDPQTEIHYLERVIEILEKEFNLSIYYLHWALNKSIKMSILEIKNVELVHFFLITKKFRLHSEFFSEILCEFIRSFSNVDFLEAEEISVFAWTTILHMLINYGKADINQQEKSSLCTPLHLAVFFKQYQFIIILLKLNADTEIRNRMGFTAVEIAEDNIRNNFDKVVYEEILGLLVAFDAKY